MEYGGMHARRGSFLDEEESGFWKMHAYSRLAWDDMKWIAKVRLDNKRSRIDLSILS